MLILLCFMVDMLIVIVYVCNNRFWNKYYYYHYLRIKQLVFTLKQLILVSRKKNMVFCIVLWTPGNLQYFFISEMTMCDYLVGKYSVFVQCVSYYSPEIIQQDIGYYILWSVSRQYIINITRLKSKVFSLERL